jgi:hypothetical protein
MRAAILTVSTSKAHRTGAIPHALSFLAGERPTHHQLS